MNLIGRVVGGLGLLVLLISFGIDTAPEGTHNIGLLQEQMMYFSLGAVLILGAVILGGLGYILTRMEEAGILPPAGYKPSPSEIAAKRQ